jgi:radical SAM protein with 4Fe4S-binding SPASM domain
LNASLPGDFEKKYVRLTEHALLRRLEKPFLYDRRSDELYELNEQGLCALACCTGEDSAKDVGLSPEFWSYCLSEGLLELLETPSVGKVKIGGPSPVPSLRYLELQITWRCNLGCRHCYLGNARPVDLAPRQVEKICREFERMGGLRLLVSGGEPLAHPQWDAVNEVLAAFRVRRALLTNGLLLDAGKLARLACDEVQISLDGMREGHDAVRGAGSFDAAVDAARRVRDAGLSLSIATQAHALNLQEFEAMSRLVEDLGAREWGIDAPCVAGRLGGHPELVVTPQEAARAMAHGFGGAYHGGSEGMACGLHLATVGADGSVAQCGFYSERPLGGVETGLEVCWRRRRPVALADVPRCLACEAGEECGGGCRYRAPAPDQPDPVMCALHGRDLP